MEKLVFCWILILTTWKLSILQIPYICFDMNYNFSLLPVKYGINFTAAIETFVWTIKQVCYYWYNCMAPYHKIHKKYWNKLEHNIKPNQNN